MLFNSLGFMFLFLPLCLLGFIYLEKKYGKTSALVWLITVSAFFYASWLPHYLIILTLSVLGNYAVGHYLHTSSYEKARKIIMTLAIIANIGVLYIFKYLLFTLNVLDIDPLKIHLDFLHNLVLPLGISFWTFQQINFLLERFNRKKDNLEFLDYISIVMFFPHLIAGPIVRASELGPQIHAVGTRQRVIVQDIAIGTILFVAGLAKKVLIADGISIFADNLYKLSPGDVSSHAGFFVAWISVLAYMLQLYFDFSGYCDMGMGLARMFGFTFPINFNSPLKAASFVEFWRTWHITLTRFFTDARHTPLAMGLMRRHQHIKPLALQNILTIGIPVLFTFFLTGIWHGAGAQFIVFGILNGILMAIGVILQQAGIGLPIRWLSRVLTFGLVCIVFIFFRAPNMAVATAILKSLFSLPTAADVFACKRMMHDTSAMHTTLLFVAMAIATLSPNLYQLLTEYHTPLGFKLSKKAKLQTFHLNIGSGLATLSALVVLVTIYQLLLGSAVEFIYFQF